MIFRPRFTLAALIALACSSSAWAVDSWPQFRGAAGDGISEATQVPLKWSEEENVAWKTPIEGKGWSSPVLGDGKLWLTTAITQKASQEAFDEKLKGKPRFAQATSELAATVLLKAIEVDYATGQIGKQVDLFYVEDPDPIHATNSYASPTPVLEGNRLYCHFGTYGTCCFDTTTGEVLWRKQLPLQHNVGPGSSPVLHNGVLILTCDGADQQYVCGLDANSGETVWKTDRPPHRNEDGDQQKAYATPLVVTWGSRTMAIIPGAQWDCAYDPLTGKELWRVDHGDGFSNVPRPVFQDGVVYICTGFTRPELWAMSVDGEGDVTDTHVGWTMSKQAPTKPSPLLWQDLLYMVSDRGIATCVDVENGETVWTERLGGNFSASPAIAEGRIYFCNEDGETIVIEPGREFKVLAENEIAGQIMATPLLLEGAIILRTDTALYRIGKK
ncbi:outer membrane protein assembly factor BamB family protein [Blastopirellula retiformator]|uniref:Serine/threonine-protein kinase AfsK n=1 Tax=Blastopirellula retiformator TaxID=2527970 RepID=A0A5C5UZL1_9BACT|nr:PQQ-binding-like beta-propeller repeat protein [Blastopirellula retiformator]TWT31558.1 Serine/threonine-protein kinase AfsK [Blastopirellula retiformator]